MIPRLEDAEAAVQQAFVTEFPDERFADWNGELDDRRAEQIIKNVGRASRINAREFINLLRDER